MTDPKPDSAWNGMGTGWTITSYMIGGIAIWGVLGFLIDRLAGLEHVFLPIGFIVGAAASIYLVWLRYGKEQGGGS
jgi:F0F1-type ATP synthase assembly protein I